MLKRGSETAVDGPSLVYEVLGEGRQHRYIAELLPDNINRVESRNLVSADVGQVIAGMFQVGA